MRERRGIRRPTYWEAEWEAAVAAAKQIAPQGWPALWHSVAERIVRPKDGDTARIGDTPLTRRVRP